MKRLYAFWMGIREFLIDIAIAREHGITPLPRAGPPGHVSEVRAMNLRPLLDEPDAAIRVTRHELLRLCIKADSQLTYESAHNALYSLREQLGDMLEDPERRIVAMKDEQ